MSIINILAFNAALLLSFSGIVAQNPIIRSGIDLQPIHRQGFLMEKYMSILPTIFWTKKERGVLYGSAWKITIYYHLKI